LPFYTSDDEDDLDLAERLRASLVAQTGVDDTTFLAPVPETADPVAGAEDARESVPPAEAPTPLQAADSVIGTPAEKGPDTVDPEASATGE
jgi:hypothetical protein